MSKKIFRGKTDFCGLTKFTKNAEAITSKFCSSYSAVVHGVMFVFMFLIHKYAHMEMLILFNKLPYLHIEYATELVVHPRVNNFHCTCMSQ